MANEEMSNLKKLRLHSLFKKLEARRNAFYGNGQGPGEKSYVEDKTKVREELQKLTDEFLANGGEIKKYGDVKIFKRRRFNTNSIFDQ